MRLGGFKAVLLDLDGVILDSMHLHAQTWQEVLGELGLTVPLEFILRHEGALGPEVLQRFVAEHAPHLAGGADMDRADAVMTDLLERQAGLYLERHARRVRPYPGAGRLLAGLERAGLPAALVTSSRRALVETSLAPELRQKFQALVTAEDVRRHKPHPDPYLAGAAALGARPQDCLVVENAPAGIASAAAAGATCYALATTLGPESLGQAQAVFADLEELAVHLGLWE